MTEREGAEGINPVDMSEQEIPAEIAAYIVQFADEAVAPIAEEDPDTAEMMREVEVAARQSDYWMYQFIENHVKPPSVLQAEVLKDLLPGMVFGEEKIVYTNLGLVPDRPEDIEHLDQSEPLPYADNEFGAILVSHIGPKTSAGRRDELVRVLRPGGVIMLNRIYVQEGTPEDNPTVGYTDDPRLRAVAIPEALQIDEIAGTEFFLYEKQQGGE
jgi:hypothetical protein